MTVILQVQRENLKKDFSQDQLIHKMFVNVVDDHINAG